jgi:hypothetical protein
MRPHVGEVAIELVLDNLSPRLSTNTGQRLGEWLAGNSVSTRQFAAGVQAK